MGSEKKKKKLDFDPFEFLGLEIGCQDSDIDKAYKKNALKWHPDKNPDKQEKAQAMFLKIYQAYEFLKDKTNRVEIEESIAARRRRSEYDDQRRASSSAKRKEFIDRLNAKETASFTPPTTVGTKRKSHLDHLFEEKRKTRDSTIEQLSRQAAEMMEAKLREKWKAQGIDPNEEDSNDEVKIVGGTTYIGNRTTESKPDPGLSQFDMSADEFADFEKQVLVSITLNMSSRKGFSMIKSASDFQQHKKRSVDAIKLEEEKSQSKKRQKLQAKLERNYEKMHMNGVEIFLPLGLTPYPTQKIMMIKMLQSLKNRWNAMIESPTGSGKTLALLSSSCAWLANYKLEREESRKNCRQHGVFLDLTTAATAASTSFCDSKDSLNIAANAPTTSAGDPIVDQEGSKEDVKLNTGDAHPEIKPVIYASHDISVFVQPDCTCLPIIRIYYGTRTHRQISQVVKEFARLPFGDNSILKHTILASREQSCVNKTVKGKPDVTSHCKELISGRVQADNNGCRVWDMEDLVKSLGKTCCPYFASTRTMATDADIIFCPFNYLLDPIIRSSSEVHLRDSIAILDEAHNVEDTCRDAASFEFQETELIWLLENVEDRENLTSC
uniref:Helicase ATP-binding domain-containing protein n=1 Tax=Ditylenchus dipsaci TaxID=166011 RepID=A0A915DEJ3_9BILA